MNIYAKIAQRYDAMFIQELSNVPDNPDNTGPVIRQLFSDVNLKSGDQHSMSISERVGGSGAEQYVVIYKHDKLTLLENYIYDDSLSQFTREPHIVKLKVDSENFYVSNIHTKPDDAFDEIYALENVADSLIGTDSDILLLGDLNADCSYFDEDDDWNAFNLIGEGYQNMISNGWDTTVATSTTCTYDRMVLSPSMATKYVPYTGKLLAFDDPSKGGFDMNDVIADGCALGYLSCSATINEAALKVSDHYPVEISLRFAGATVIGCSDGGNYGDGGISSFSDQQVADTLSFVNSASISTLDSCTGITNSEATNLVAGAPFTAIGTIGSDEITGASPGHIDSISAISDASSDNDLLRLRDCAPATSSCSN